MLDKIIEAKELMGDDAANVIADYYKLEKFDEVALKGCCPFHGEDTPSFIWNKKGKYFKCFGCGKKVGILDLYTETEGSYYAALKRLFKEVGVDFSSKGFKTERKSLFEDKIFPEEPTNIDREIVDRYAQKRGISTTTLDYLDVREDDNGNCMFLLRDVDSKLTSIKYRPARKVEKGSPRFWWDSTGAFPCLFNINKVDISEPLVICEGFFDALAIVESGYRNVVSIPGGAEDLNWIEYNYDFLKNFSQIILWFDNDKAGDIGREKVQQRLGEYRCRIVKPDDDDVAAVSNYYAKFNFPCTKTDANNILLSCGSSRVLSLIELAEEIPSKRLKYLMDCSIANVMDIEKTSTGIKALDNIMYGNLFPCFTIYSGKTGNGKSTVANISSIISPVENGYKTFIFSGELSEGQLADWIVTPLAGYNHIQEIKTGNESDRPFYVVTQQAEKQIKSYYRRNMIIYNSDDGLAVSESILLDAMEEAYQRHGCRVFLIDNLMCIAFENVDEESKWDIQKNFILKLMRFAEKYKSCVNLVLHPKKMTAFSKEPSASDLHGASEIGNLCHRLLWVDRLNPDDQGYNTRITVIKDRPTQSAGKCCDLYYDTMTRRIFTDNEEQRSPYSWESSVNISYTSEEDKLLIYKKPQRPLPHEESNYAPPM